MWLLLPSATRSESSSLNFISAAKNNRAHTVHTARATILSCPFYFLNLISSWASTCQNPAKKWMLRRESAIISSMRLEKCKSVVDSPVTNKFTCRLIILLSVTTLIPSLTWHHGKICELIISPSIVAFSTTICCVVNNDFIIRLIYIVPMSSIKAVCA